MRIICLLQPGATTYNRKKYLTVSYSWQQTTKTQFTYSGIADGTATSHNNQGLINDNCKCVSQSITTTVWIDTYEMIYKQCCDQEKISSHGHIM